jgi:hypothetical protein
MGAVPSKGHIWLLNLPRITFGEEAEMPAKLCGNSRA